VAKRGFRSYEEALEACEIANRAAENAQGTGRSLRFQEVYEHRDPVTNARKWFLRAIPGQPEATHKMVFRKR
jgi:hypothetical protein